MTTSIPCTCTHLQEAHDPIAGCGYCHCTSFSDATTKYSAELRQLGEMALDSAKRDLERGGSVWPFFLMRWPNGDLDTMRVPREYESRFNDRNVRQRIYHTIRIMVDAFDITAVVTAGEAWVGCQTEKGRLLSKQEFLAIASDGSGFRAALERGLIERTEAIVVTVQTPQRLMALTQTYARKGPSINFRELMISENDIASLSGALKMFGNQEEEEDVDIAASNPRSRS